METGSKRLTRSKIASWEIIAGDSIQSILSRLGDFGKIKCSIIWIFGWVYGHLFRLDTTFTIKGRVYG